MDEKGSDVLQLSHAKHRKTAFQTSKCPESATPATRNGHSSSKNEHGSLVKRRLRKRENRAAHLVRACAVKSCRPDEQRPKGLIECLSHGFAYSQATCASTMVWDVRQSYATLTRLELPKTRFLCKELLTRPWQPYAWAYAMHLSPKCLRYASLRNPAFCLRRPNSHMTQLLQNKWRFWTLLRSPWSNPGL